ncbi:MAG: c-type cytochrome [Halioglobus sp.]|nr:c-type cytochrome [Halioglobus sp.]
MNNNTIALVLFALFALGLPLYGMQTNGVGGGNTHECTGECYAQWRAQTGGVVAVAAADAAARAAASPAQLGEKLYAGCVACHGPAGQGGVGPRLAGQSAETVSTALAQYRNGATRGAQSALMWSQSAQLSDSDIANLAAYIETF